VLDASSHLHEGILTGNVLFLGSYSSCLDVNVPPHNFNGSDIQGFK
jgi:hypothetical protein